MMLTTVSGAWADDSGSCGTDVTYSYVSSTKTLTISGSGAMTDYIPVNRPWIGYVDNITSVVIGSGVTHIGMGAFDRCENLTTVTFDGTPTSMSIGELAFNKCAKLESITLPAGVTSIGNDAFNGCTGLTTINIPASVTTISNSAFYGCTNLVSISFAANTPLKSSDIGSTAFQDCTNLKTLKISGTGAMADYESYNQPWISIKDQITTVTIESGVTAIGDDAFLSCTNLASVTIPATVTSIGQWAFNGCSSLTAFNVAEENTNYSSADGVLFNKAKTKLIKYPAGNTATSYTIPATVTTVGDEAFLSCTKLTSVSIPVNVTSIGTFAFDGCTNLASVSFAANTPLRNTNIGTDAFQDCTKLKTLKISGTGAIPSYENNQPWISLKDQITTVTIESGVTAIGNSAFYGCTNLASVTIPATVTSIGQWAFSECSKLTTVTFDGTSELKTIDEEAFNNCSTLASINIPASVTSIGVGVFYGCTNLASISFAANTQLKSTNIGNNAFLGCTKLKTLTISGTCEMKDYTGGAYDQQPWKSFRDQITTLTIESNVTTIGASAFEECTNLASVTIPSTMISIGDNAFIMCSKLASVNIPASVTAIGNYAFNGCSSLTAFNVADGNANYSSDEIGVLFDKAKTKLIQYPASNTATSYTIPASVTTIDDRAFYQCTNLASVNIPASVTDIDEYAFNGSASLTAFNVAEGNAKYSSDAAGVLFNKAKTTLIQYPAGNTATSYTIPATVTSIGYNAFLSCTNLTSVTIPANVTSIGRTAFKNCTNLASVIVNATTPPTLGTEVFDENASVRKIYVPSASVGTYKGTTGWNDYESAIEAFQTVASGTCGENVTWEISGFENDYLLTISGTGAMEGYNPGKQPWKDYDGGITTVVIGNGVTNIGRNICYEYTTLTYVSIPASVTSIGEQAFEGCTNLTSVSIPAGVTSIGEEAFFGCSSLSSINIPAGIETFDRSWFNGCSSLTAINVANENVNYASADGVLFNKAKTTLILYPLGKEANPYTIPSTVTTIGDDAFSWSTKLTSVTIPASVTTIGDGAFSNSEKLASVTFATGSSLTSISDYAFFNCDNLTSFTIPAGVTSIGNDAFYGCSKLTSVSIPAGVTSIGESAFSTCVKLPSITLPASVTTIGNSAFYQCIELATLTLNSSPQIGEEAFDNLKSGAVVAINAPAHDAASYQWATFYNKTCNFKADANTQVFKVTLAGSTVTLLEVTDKIVNAGTAVVLKSTGTPVMTLTTASSSDMQGNNLVGTSANKKNPGNAYVLNYTAADGVGFYKLASDGTIGFGKAYLVATAGAREFLTFGETTSLSPIPSPKGEGSDVIYDIHGRRVNGKPSKGLYIINGKKIVMK